MRGEAKLTPCFALFIFYIFSGIAFWLWFGVGKASILIYQGLSLSIFFGLALMHHNASNAISFDFSSIAKASIFFMLLTPLFGVFFFASAHLLYTGKAIQALLFFIMGNYIVYSSYFKISPLPFLHRKNRFKIGKLVEKELKFQHSTLKYMLEKEQALYSIRERELREKIERSTKNQAKKEQLELNFSSQLHELKMRKLKESIIAQYKMGEDETLLLQKQLDQVDRAKLTQEQKSELFKSIKKLYKL